MKRILLCAGIFVVIFVLALIAVFPMSTVVKNEIDRQIALYNIQLTYNELKSGVFSTRMNGISYMGTPVGDLKVSYSPLSVLTKKVRVTTDSDILEVNALYKGNELTADIDADLHRLLTTAAKAFPDMAVDMKGQATANITYNLSDMKGKLTLNGTDFSVQTPMMPLNLSSFNAEADMDNTSLIITSFNSEPIQISISGRVNINPNETKNSTMNLFIESLGMRYAVQGRLSNPVVRQEN